MVAADMLKPTEAAVVARVSLRDVNRAIDEHILPEGFFSLDDGRRVAALACMLISFYFDSAGRLTAEERRRAVNEAAVLLRKFYSGPFVPPSKGEWTVRNDFLTIDLGPFAERAYERMERLAAARNLVVSDPEILGGTPVIRGTRVPVHDVAASAAAGVPAKRILAAYPSLDADKIELAKLYSEANPARGRPRSARRPKGAVTITNRRVPRRERWRDEVAGG